MAVGVGGGGLFLWALEKSETGKKKITLSAPPWGTNPGGGKYVFIPPLKTKERG